MKRNILTMTLILTGLVLVNSTFAAKVSDEPGYVDLDLAQFFDEVNHDILMARIGLKVKDWRVKKLIRRYLRSGVLSGGVVSVPERGTPQGGPLSPLLSNIVLDDLDKELEKRGLRFARYADMQITVTYMLLVCAAANG